MKPLSDGGRDILREQEDDVRGLEPDVPLVEDLIAALADIYAAASIAVACEPDENRRDVLAGIRGVADAAIKQARGL